MTAGLIFARMDSRRLPGKAIADIGGKPMLARVIERARRSERVTCIVVATSGRAVDDPIAACALELGIDCHRGPADDLVARALGWCDAAGAECFLRISGDSPFIDPNAMSAACDLFESRNADLATNVFPRSFPPGCSVEVLRADLLRRAHPEMTPDDREHVSPWFYRNADRYDIANLVSGRSFADVRLTVDDEDELAQARWIAARYGASLAQASLDSIVGLAREYRQTLAGAGA